MAKMRQMTEDQIGDAADFIRVRNRITDILTELGDEKRPMGLSILVGHDQTIWDTIPPIPREILMEALELIKAKCAEQLDHLIQQ